MKQWDLPMETKIIFDWVKIWMRFWEASLVLFFLMHVKYKYPNQLKVGSVT